MGFYLFSVAIRPALCATCQLVSSCCCQLNSAPVFEDSHLDFPSLAVEACQSQHGCDSLCSHLSPSSIHYGKASVCQFWDPNQRAGGTSKPDFLPTGEVA